MRKLVIGFWLLVIGVCTAQAAAPFAGGDSKAPVEITADSLEVLQQQKKAIFNGNVIATQGKMNLKADKMTVYYSGADTSGKSISKIDVDGNVFLTTGTETARGSSGVYNVVNDFITLNGNVVLTRENNVLKGSKLEYDIKNGRSKLIGGVTTTTAGQPAGTGRVQALFIPEDKGKKQ